MCRPTAMSADHPAASDGGPVVSRTEGRSAIASPRCIPSMCFYTCATAPETRPLPAVSCTPSPPRRRPIVQQRPTGRGALDSPARRPGPPGADDHCASPVALPLPSPLAVLGAPPPAMSILSRWRWGPVIGWEQRRVWPVIPPPFVPPTAIQLRSRR